MPIPHLSSLLLAAALAGQGPRAASDPESPERPALVVIVAVDQLAAWVLRDALPACGERGFKRLMREGVGFARCTLRHACTETAPGHATLSTGADPARHGIIANEWHDPATFEKVYCCEDAAQRGIGGDGDRRGPKNLLAPTLGDRMKSSFGATSKVVSISWKDRAAILLAGHAADQVLWFSKQTGLLVSTTAYGSELPGWAAAFNGERPSDRCFGRVWQPFGPTRAYAGLVDDVVYERADANGMRTLPATIDGGERVPGARFYEHLYESPFANELLLEAALRAIRANGLGADGPPDLLCISFSSNDTIGHRNGPESFESRDMTLRTDDLIAQLLDALDREVGRGRWALMLSADHGVHPIPELAKQRGLASGRGPLSKWGGGAIEAALLEKLGNPPAGGRSWMRAAEDGLVYLDREALTGLGHDLAHARRVAAAAALKVRGIAQARTWDETCSSYATSDATLVALRRAAHPERSPDVVLVPSPYWIDGMAPATHGTPWPQDREVPLLVVGKGLRAGAISQAEVGSGLGVVLLAELLRIPRPAAAEDRVPDGVLER